MRVQREYEETKGGEFSDDTPIGSLQYGEENVREEGGPGVTALEELD